MDTFARCPACGRMIPTKADYCPLCGAKLRLIAKMPKPEHKPERKPDEAAKPEPERDVKRTRFSSSDARRAVVAAEILSPPVSKRRR